MLENKLQEMAAKYNSRLETKTEKVSATLGSVMTITTYSLNLIYNTQNINCVLEFGNSNMAEFPTEISISRVIPDFTISTIDHFTRLFTFSKKIWKINCVDDLYKKQLTLFLNQSGLTPLEEKEAFEPTIAGLVNDRLLKLNIKYYLGFDQKEKSIGPAIEFFKIMINPYYHD